MHGDVMLKSFNNIKQFFINWRAENFGSNYFSISSRNWFYLQAILKCGYEANLAEYLTMKSIKDFNFCLKTRAVISWRCIACCSNIKAKYFLPIRITYKCNKQIWMTVIMYVSHRILYVFHATCSMFQYWAYSNFCKTNKWCTFEWATGPLSLSFLYSCSSNSLSHAFVTLFLRFLYMTLCCCDSLCFFSFCYLF